MSQTSSGDSDQGSSAPGGRGSPGGAGAPGGPSGPAAAGGPGAGSPPPYPRPPFPWARLFYAIGFSFVAWAVFWVIVALLMPLHYITIAITGRANEELQQMSLRATHYLYQLLGFVSGAHDEKPFPLGPFPKD